MDEKGQVSMKACAVAFIVISGLGGFAATARAQSRTGGHAELDLNGLVAASGAYVYSLGDGRYSVGGRAGWAWEWGRSPNPFLWSAATFDHPIFEPFYVDAIARAHFRDTRHRRFAQLEAGPTLMRYAWGDDGAGSGTFAGIHIGAGVGWGKVSGGISVRYGHAVNAAGNAPRVPPASNGILWTPYLRIGF